MGKYLKKFENHAAYEAAQSGLILPNVSLCVNENEVYYNPLGPHNYSRDYLTFVATESGTFKFSGNSVNYSLDNGNTWNELASDTNTPTVSAGSKIMWKATGLTPTSSIGIGIFNSTNNFTVEGNVMSLYYGDDFIGKISLEGKNYAFNRLFSGCTKMTSAENLSLPATTLADYCYSSMFYGCSGLTIAPELPATTLANFSYQEMFTECTSLTTGPELPATTLATSCYRDMFDSCTGLTTAPVLPAATLEAGSYYGMFRNCRSLNSITCLATDISALYCTYYWISNEPNNGTFTKPASMTSWTRGRNGIPTNWTVVDIN